MLQTGDFDYAWNLQVEPDVLAELEKGGKGVLKVVAGTSVERIEFQFADWKTESDGRRRRFEHGQPDMGDKAVRQAVNLSCQRDVISQQLYAGEPASRRPRTI